MNAPEALDQFLLTDPADVGCETAMDLLHVYVELVVNGDQRNRARYIGVEAHLAACGPCAEDFQGLLRAVQSPQ